MDRREFIKNSALATVGGLLLTTPLANISAQTKDKSNKELTNEPYHMRVLLINGSPRKNGNTFAALNEASKRLETHDIETEIVQIGAKPIRGCIACGQCHSKGLGRCVFDDDLCNRIVEKLDDVDALIVGSPVYYGGPNGSLCALLDRVFYSLSAELRFKPAASVVVCRRGGASAAFDRLNKYFTMSNMPLVSSQYWNMVYGQTPGQVAQDEEGMQTMRTLARNMAWMIRKLNVSEDGHPELESPMRTNFIR